MVATIAPDASSARPTGARVAVVVLGAVYLLTAGLPSLHLVTERHAICAEHGELTHVDVHGAHGEPPLTADGVVLTEREDAGAHGHCALPHLVAVTRTPAATVTAGPVATAPRVVLATPDVSVARDVLVDAPKTSPPVRA